MLRLNHSSTIIEAVKTHCHSAEIANAFFYFDFADVEKQRCDPLIRSLIAQISKQSDDTSKYLEDLYRDCGEGTRSTSTDQLEKTLEKIIIIFQKVYILLDALDECSEREQLLELITTMSQWKNGKLSTLMTSRREADIEEVLGPLAKRQI